MVEVNDDDSTDSEDEEADDKEKVEVHRPDNKVDVWSFGILGEWIIIEIFFVIISFGISDFFSISIY